MPLERGVPRRRERFAQGGERKTGRRCAAAMLRARRVPARLERLTCARGIAGPSAGKFLTTGQKKRCARDAEAASDRQTSVRSARRAAVYIHIRYVPGQTP